MHCRWRATTFTVSRRGRCLGARLPRGAHRDTLPHAGVRRCSCLVVYQQPRRHGRPRSAQAGWPGSHVAVVVWATGRRPVRSARRACGRALVPGMGRTDTVASPGDVRRRCAAGPGPSWAPGRRRRAMHRQHADERRGGGVGGGWAPCGGTPPRRRVVWVAVWMRGMRAAVAGWGWACAAQRQPAAPHHVRVCPHMTQPCGGGALRLRPAAPPVAMVLLRGGRRGGGGVFQRWWMGLQQRGGGDDPAPARSAASRALDTVHWSAHLCLPLTHPHPL